jgi:spore cortex formation protein SpoVR/YcgB (stage V sporulation)
MTDLKRLDESVREYTEKHGKQAVTQLIDSCHAIKDHMVDRYPHPPRPTQAEVEARRTRIERERERSVNHVMDTTMPKRAAEEFADAKDKDGLRFAGEENLATFIATYAPRLEDWERDLVTQIGNISQYFYPQKQTQVMNEGTASFVHYNIMNDMHDMDLLSDGMMLEFLHSHSSVVFQPDFDDPRFSGINPYALGFAMMRDIKRYCTEPTEEDRAWFEGKGILDRPWLDVWLEAIVNYRDEDFILQYISPQLIRDFKLFAVNDDTAKPALQVSAIHDDLGYKRIRSGLSRQYNLGNREPDIETAGYDYLDTRTLTINHNVHDGVLLEEKSAREVLKHICRLWGYPVKLQSVDREGKILKTMSAEPPPRSSKQSGPGLKAA